MGCWSAPKDRHLPEVKTLANAVLKTKEGWEILAGSLWQNQPVLLVGVRRSGCGKCVCLNASIVKLYANRAYMHGLYTRAYL